MSVEKIQVPDIGDEQEVEVIEILVSPGDEVSENDSLIVLESDKAAMEIPSPQAGVVKEVLVNVGEQVSQGSAIVSIDVGAVPGNAESESSEESVEKENSFQDAPANNLTVEVAEEPTAVEAHPAPTGSASVQEIRVPDLGGDSDVEVIEILVAEGDEIDAEDGLVILESDKAAMDIPSPAAGKVLSIKLKVGDKVNEGALVLELESVTASADSTVAPAVEESQPESKVVENPSLVPAPSGKPELLEIKVPDLGEDSDLEVIDILIAVDDEIKKENGLITLETDKAAMDVPSPSAGVVKAIKVKVGDKVSQGSVILDLEKTASESALAEKASPTPEQTAPVAEKPQVISSTAQQTVVTTGSNRGGETYAGPAVRKMARELGVDLTKVPGSGSKGRIVKEDVEAYVKGIMQGGAANVSAGDGGLPGIEDIDFSKFGEIEEVDRSKLHQVVARNMSRNWLNVPHVTQFGEVDVTELEEFRQAQKALAEKKGVKLTPLSFIVKACAHALNEYPQFNVSLHSSGAKLIQKKYVYIGIAVATPAGLMVPVLKNVDRKSIWEIAAEIAELGEKAKDRKLAKEEMQGACFTVSSLGNLGGTGFTPIVNAPEVAILGVSKTSVKPVYIDGEFVPRKMLPFALSYDHRVVNGVDGGLFCTFLGSLLNDTRLLAL